MARKRTGIIALLVIAMTLFLGWRFLRPMNIFVVSEAFERPISTARIPAPLKGLSAKECGTCHRDFYEEWSTAMHSRAWTDPYFQADLRFDGSQQICKNCHIPLDRQQQHRVVGFRDREKWDPILEPNPDFDPELQHEGVTCAACHFREGKILGTYGSDLAPHPIEKLENGSQVCVRCHVVGGERWDTFFRFPPCGTVAEIQASQGPPAVRSGEAVVPAPADLGCVGCHMPLVERPVVDGGPIRPVRRHLWRGGHHPEMVKSALDVQLRERSAKAPAERAFVLTLTNVGAAHYLPTGTPDRHLTVDIRLLDREGRVLKETHHTLERMIMWRPFIIDLWDTRLPRWEPRSFDFAFSMGREPAPTTLEVVVRYHLLGEWRRRRIGYENEEPIAYEVYRRRVPLRT